MIFAVLTGGLPNRLTAVTFSRVTFVPTRSGSFQEPALIQYLAVTARVMTESEAFAVALERVDRLSDLSAEHEGEAVRAKSAVIVDIGAMPGADRRLVDLVSGLPRYRSKEITAGRVALKSTTPAVGRLPGVVGRAELINQFNARAVPIASEDPDRPGATAWQVHPVVSALTDPNRETSAARGPDEALGRRAARRQEAPRQGRCPHRARRQRDCRGGCHVDDDGGRSLRAVRQARRRQDSKLALARARAVKVGGLDLARRRDFSALVTLEVAAEGATVTRALRLPQAPYREQLDLIAPLLADLDDLAFDAGGIGDAIGEHLPPDAIPIVIVAGDGPPRLHQGRWRIGKVLLIQNVLVLAGRRPPGRSGERAGSQSSPRRSSSISGRRRRAEAPGWRRKGRRTMTSCSPSRSLSWASACAQKWE